jgi:hypothetical protein
VGGLPNELLYGAGIASGYDTRDQLGFVGLAVDESTSNRLRATMPEPVCEHMFLSGIYSHS